MPRETVTIRTLSRSEIASWLEEHGDIIVTVRDSLNAGYCVNGVMRWYDSYGIDRRYAVKNGMSAKWGFEKNDPQADRSICAAIARHNMKGVKP